MRILAISTLREYWEKHPDAEMPLRDWYTKVKVAQWKSLADMKETFNSADYVGKQRYVFNIHGGNHRLVAVVRFTPGLVYIRFIGTHKEYEKIKADEI